MKRFLAAFVALTLLTGCSGGGTTSESSAKKGSELITEPQNQSTSGEAIVIGDKFFIAQTDDIFLNLKSYLGKTVIIEGIFTTIDTGEPDPAYYVLRDAPGCCGDDGQVGLEISWDGEMPAENDWVEATGVIEAITQDGSDFPILKLSSLTVKEERGQDFVTE